MMRFDGYHAVNGSGDLVNTERLKISVFLRDGHDDALGLNLRSVLSGVKVLQLQLKRAVSFLDHSQRNAIRQGIRAAAACKVCDIRIDVRKNHMPKNLRVVIFVSIDVFAVTMSIKAPSPMGFHSPLISNI